MLYLKPKQKKVVELANDPSIHTIVLLGSVGTGKTDIAAHISISIAYSLPKTYWTVFRQNLSTAKKTIIPSYLNMLDMMNFIEGEDYRHDRSLNEIQFLHNKSKIGFIEADVTKDRQGKKIKGINASGNHIDEADELAQIMFTQAVSRRGRFNHAGQPSISIVTMNPNDTYLKTMYYEPYRNGTLPKGVVVVEFDMSDSWQTKEDIEAMMQNPRPWVERYIRNRWDYSDDQDSLFKYRYFDACITDKTDINDKRYIGYDVARSGSDRSIIALWWGKTLVDIQIIKDKTESITTDDQALELIKYMTLNAVIPQNIAVDAVGVGVGVIDHAKSKGIRFTEFVSGGKPTFDKYDNLRSQVIFEFAQGLEKGEIKIYEGCPLRNELISEAMLHTHKINDKKLAVEPKDKIKERTGGVSPDIMDAVVMGLYPQLNINPKQNISRIIY